MLLAAQIATPHQSMEKKLLVVVAHTAIEGMIAVCQTLESKSSMMQLDCDQML